MLKTKVDIKQIGREVAEFLSNYIKVNRLILYGSYAHDNPREDSDLDIAVISEDLKKMTIIERMELFSKAALIIDSRIELKGFDKSEYMNPAKASMLEVIKKKGKVIYS